MLKALFKKLAVLGLILFIYQNTTFADDTIKPFVLAFSGAGELSAKLSETKEKLSALALKSLVNILLMPMSTLSYSPTTH